MARWEISTEGASQTTILKCHGTPVARFYAGRLTGPLKKEIERKLNA